MIALRDYQQQAIYDLIGAEQQRLMLVAPTGSGKTVIASEVIREVIREGGAHVLFLAHRRELIHQTRIHLGEFGIRAGIILAGQPVDMMRGVQVASIQTLHSRCIRGRQELPPAGLVFVDEAHHATAQSWRTIIGRFPEAKIVGMTATPIRRDGRGLGGIFEHMIETPQVPELIALGYLVGTKVYAPTVPDLKGVRTRQGDYAEEQLAAVMDQAQLVGDIVTHWHRLADGRKTVVFATSVAHSIHLHQEFCKSGVRAEHIDGQTDKAERDEILARLSEGDLDLVTNCMVLTEGWDMPSVACCVLARPTKSMGLYRQMVGRVIRPAPGKTDALVLDHAGATFLHGFVEDRVEWTLDPDTRAAAPAHAARTNGHAANRLVACTKCQAIRTAGQPCPQCGHMPRRPGRYEHVRDGDLARLDRDGRQHAQRYGPEDRERWHRQLAAIAEERGYKRGWAAHQFKAKFGAFPPFVSVEPMTPSPEVRSWVRSRQIAWAKSQERRAAGG